MGAILADRAMLTTGGINAVERAIALAYPQTSARSVAVSGLRPPPEWAAWAEHRRPLSATASTSFDMPFVQGGVISAAESLADSQAPHDVAEAVIWLGSSLASIISDANLAVHGGSSAVH